jgi:hypothetical protein
LGLEDDSLPLKIRKAPWKLRRRCIKRHGKFEECVVQKIWLMSEFIDAIQISESPFNHFYAISAKILAEFMSVKVSPS